MKRSTVKTIERLARQVNRLRKERARVEAWMERLRGEKQELGAEIGEARRSNVTLKHLLELANDEVVKLRGQIERMTPQGGDDVDDVPPTPNQELRGRLVVVEAERPE